MEKELVENIFFKNMGEDSIENCVIRSQIEISVEALVEATREVSTVDCLKNDYHLIFNMFSARSRLSRFLGLSGGVGIRLNYELADDLRVTNEAWQEALKFCLSHKERLPEQYRTEEDMKKMGSMLTLANSRMSTLVNELKADGQIKLDLRIFQEINEYITLALFCALGQEVFERFTIRVNEGFKFLRELYNFLQKTETTVN